jgi:hypothetical protein
VDQVALVKSDIEVEGKVVEALSRAQVPVTAVDWNWVPQLDEFQLIVVTPWVDSKGPRETYARIFAALSNADVYQSVPVRKLLVKSPEDPAAKNLVEDLKKINEGAIHVVCNSHPNGQARYSVVFTPYLGSGGAIPAKHLLGDGELRNFLEKRVGVHGYVVDRAIVDLGQSNSSTIFNVQLTSRRAKQLNLAA